MTEAQRRILLFLGGLIVTLLVVILVMLFSGGDDAPGTTAAVDATSSTAGAGTSTVAATTTAVTTSAAATTTPAASTTTEATTTTSAAGACSGIPGLAVPPGALAGPQADFDGDGALDRLVAFQDGGGAWWVAIRLSYGYAQGTAVSGPAEARSIFSFDGFPVGFARVESGASTEFIGAVYWLGCSLYEATVDSGAVARFPLGGSVTHIDGMRCSGDRLTTTGYETADGVNFEYRETDYLWVPGLGEFQVFLSSIQMLHSPADDAVIFAAGDYTC